MFLVFVVVVTCAAFVLLNSESAAFWLRFPSIGRRDRTVEGVVQFYPDNQNKMLFRKSRVFNREETIDTGAARGSFTGAHVREKLSAVKEEVGVPRKRIGAEQLVGKNSTILSYNVHLFYYAWYGSPKFDGGK